MDLATPLKSVLGIGSFTALKLKRLNLNTVEDLIYHFPFRYDDFSNTTSIMDSQVGEIVTLQGEIWSIKNIYTRFGKVLTQAIFNDGTSPITLTWFNQGWLTKQIQVGDKLQVSGKISKYKSKLAIMAPKWEKIPDRRTFSDPGSEAGLHTGRLVSVYPETSGLTSKWIRTKISQLLPQVLSSVVDPLPNHVKNNMLALTEAISLIHLPTDFSQAEKARERLGFDELFYVALATQKTRMEWKAKPTVKPLNINKSDLEDFIQGLPFELTESQKRVITEIIQDIQTDQAMNRLVQGEVGSGKTVVAAAIAYVVFKNGLQTLFMAPTEILAFQHYQTFVTLLKPLGVKVGIYTGSRKKAADSDVVIGTHALLSDKLAMGKVGLVVVDEQQRFGVQQRSYLRGKSQVPHFLTMTATPIPRSLSLTLYGDLDLSIIDEMPKNRPVIKTHLVPEKKRTDSYKFIEKKILEGDQAYIITPLIETSETLITLKAVKVEYEKLKKVFPKLKLGLLHGRLKPKEKEQVLQLFRAGKIHILVSTSVVEVGMDVPNATIMVIEGAERFGLSQLHQLRGRIGRGTKISYCLLYTSDVSSDRKRLKFMETTFDGLKLAELDLKIRGAGEIFGIKQSGRFDFKIASFSNLHLVEKARESAKNLLQDNPKLDKYPLLRRKLQDLAKAKEVMPD